MKKFVFRIAAGFSIFGIVNFFAYVILRCFGVVDYKIAAYASFALYGLVIWMPWLLHIYFKVKFPRYVLYMYSIFMVATTILGNVWDAYTIIPFYDKVIHFTSGVMVPIIFIWLFTSHKANSLSTFWLFVFAFSCAVGVGAIWEVVEFFFDGVFMSNSQNALGLIGRAALEDTMFDLVCDSLGGAIGATQAVIIYLRRIKQPELKSVLSSN